MDHRRRGAANASGPFGDLRRRVDEDCARVASSRESLEQRRASLAEVRRSLARVEHVADEARSETDPVRLADAKAAAQAAYRKQIGAGVDEFDKRRAAQEWMTTIDRLNREVRRARQQLARADRESQRLNGEVTRHERTADAARITLEAAMAACSDARQALADADTSTESGAPTMTSGRTRAIGGRRPAVVDPVPPASVTSDDSAVPAEVDLPPATSDDAEPTPRRPILIELMLDGDRDAYQAIAEEVSHLTGQPVSHYLLLLHALVESLSQIALERHFLAFDGDHPFWSQFDPSEQLAIVSSLADLGFHLDPMEGWLDGRRPTASELVMSLAYAGRDPRALRRMPAPEEIEDLPRSVHVVTLQLLARSAPDLTLDELLDLMGQRGESFGQLWDDWGRIRPVLLSEVGALAA